MVTHGDDDVDRAALALLLAEVDAKKIGRDVSGVSIWFTLPGAKLCRKGAAEKLTSPIFKKFGTLADILGGRRESRGETQRLPVLPRLLRDPEIGVPRRADRKGGDYVAAQVGKADVIWM